MMLTNPITSAAAKAGLAYLDYLTTFWLPESLWKSWSYFGRIQAARILEIPVGAVASTTNHLEAFNAILKHKYITDHQRGGKRLRFDLLMFLLVTQILPAIFERRKAEESFYDWLSSRFARYGQGNLSRAPEKKLQVLQKFEFAWWTSEARLRTQEEVQYIIGQKRIANYSWLGPYQLAATCASSVEDIRLLSHKRYTMIVNCYGWARCSCPAFEKRGFACKHLWAFRTVITRMQTQYTFIFPESFEEAQQIYSSLFIPKIPTDLQPTEPPTLVSETLRPAPITNSLAKINTDIDDLMDSITVAPGPLHSNSEESETSDQDTAGLGEASDCSDIDDGLVELANVSHFRTSEAYIKVVPDHVRDKSSNHPSAQ